jgi:hypothetical protein
MKSAWQKLSTLMVCSFLVPVIGCQSVQPSLRLQPSKGAQKRESFDPEAIPEFHPRKQVTILDLADGSRLFAGVTAQQVLDRLGHPALKIYESEQTVWVLADGSELGMVAGTLRTIELSDKAQFDEHGYYLHHRMRHHGGVPALLSAITPKKSSKKTKIKKLPRKPLILKGPWVWHGPNFARTNVRKSPPRIRTRRPKSNRGFRLFIIR